MFDPEVMVGNVIRAVNHANNQFPRNVRASSLVLEEVTAAAIGAVFDVLDPIFIDLKTKMDLLAADMERAKAEGKSVR